jgi:acetyl esterase/lipase
MNHTMKPAVPAVLEPAAQDLIRRLTMENTPPLEELGPAKAREYMALSQPTRFGGQHVCVKEQVIAGVRCVLVRPARGHGKLPVVLYLHGGGWTLGAPETHARLIQEICVRTQCAVVAPEYALAPEHRYPEALNQCFSVAEEIQRGAAAADIDGSRLAVAGDSAGGNLAAALAVLAAERGGVRFALQALICPALRRKPLTESYRLYGKGLNLTTDAMQWFWQQYAPDEALGPDAHVAPLLAPLDVLARVAPAWIVTAGCDILRDEGEEYGLRLLEAGNQATVLCCFGTIHNFPVIDDLQASGPALAATAALCTALLTALRGEGAAQY